MIFDAFLFQCHYLLIVTIQVNLESEKISLYKELVRHKLKSRTKIELSGYDGVRCEDIDNRQSSWGQETSHKALHSSN